MHGGIYVTAYARRNLLENVRKLDKYVIYCDTDSIKLADGFDESIIENYNKQVKEKLENISKRLKINFEKYSPEDIKGKKHLIGLFEDETKDGSYQEFITQGAKKYAYRDKDGELHITVSGVPKSGVKDLNNDISNFKDDLVFKYETTGKNVIQYNDEQCPFDIEDVQGNKVRIIDKYGIALLPTTYILGKSDEYAEFLEDNYSDRSKYKEDLINE